MNPRYYIKHMVNIDLVKPVPQGAIEYALDLGCGNGGDTKYLASLGFVVTPVDNHPHFEHAIIADLRTYVIEPEKYSVIICNNVLPFIKEKKHVRKIIKDIVVGLKPGAAAFLTLYGLNSGYKDRKDMSFYSYEEILPIVEALPVEIMDKTTSEGYSKNGKGEIIYQHSHRFILRKRS